MKNKALHLSILFILLVTGISPFLSEMAVAIYLPSAIVLAGMVAIVLQKKVHQGRFAEMGFKLNRNALMGIGIGLLFTMAFVFINYALTYYLGVGRFTLDVFYYLIFPNPDYGLASNYAIYHVDILNDSAATAVQLGWPIFSIFLMLGLCRIAKKWTRNT